jgi:hypothetical protein
MRAKVRSGHQQCPAANSYMSSVACISGHIMEGEILTVSLTGWSQEMCRGFIITLVKTKGSPCSGRMMEVLGPRNFQQLPLLASR